MKKNGFIVIALYPILVTVTGIMAVFLSTSKSNKLINHMKLDIDTSIFDSVTCDCEVINNTLKKYGERINTVDKTIEKIRTDLENVKKVGNATSTDILAGKTALVKGKLVTGSIPNNGALNQALKAGETFTIPSGYTTGGTITAPTLESQTPGNATAAQILKDKTAWVNGSKITGSMPLKNGSSEAIKIGTNTNNVYFVFPYGYYPAENHFSTANSSEVYVTNANIASAIGLTKEKLLKGEKVLGITGTGETSCPASLDTSDATATAADILSGKTAYVNGSKITGSMVNQASYTGAVSVAFSNGTIYTRIPQGAYLTNTTIGSPEIIFSTDAIGIKPEKIVKGQSIAGIEGTASSFANHHFHSSYIQDTSATIQKKYIEQSNKDTETTTWNDWIELSSSGGSYTSTSDTDKSWDKTTVWELDIDNNFYKAGKVELTLLSYNGTQASLDKSGTSEFYTKIHNGYEKDTTNEQFVNLVPKITILKDINSWDVFRVISNVDVDIDQNKLVYDSTSKKLTDRSIWKQSGFTAVVNSEQNKLILEYYSYKYTQDNTFNSVKVFSYNEAGESAKEDEWLMSDASNDYIFYGFNVTGTKGYWYKKEGAYKTTNGNGTHRLKAKYNHWYVSMQYYD
jgi:hypothetical protein